MKSYLFHSGKIWKDRDFVQADLLISNGKIEKIGELRGPVAQNVETIDLKGIYILPGFCDLFCQFPEGTDLNEEIIKNFAEQAIRGGFTSIAVSPTTHPVNDNAFVSRHLISNSENQKCHFDYLGSLTKDLVGNQLAEIGLMKESGVIGLTDGKSCIADSYVLRKAMDYAQTFDLLVMSFPDDKNLSRSGLINEGIMSTQLGLAGKSPMAEAIAISRDLYLAEWTKARLHIPFVSTLESIELFAHAKEKGLPVSCSVSPHQLLFTEDDLINYDTNFKLEPPLRTKKDQDALLDALDSGVIDCFCSDHHPISELNKKNDFVKAKPGVISLETATLATYQLVLKKKISLKTWIEAWSSKPRTILGKKIINIETGERAELSFFDPNSKVKIEKDNFVSKLRNSPFIDQEFQGKMIGTFYEGRYHAAKSWKVVD